MILNEETYYLAGRTVTLRSANVNEADMLVTVYKQILDETEFLSMYPDECTLDVEGEKSYIEKYNNSDDKIFILAFVDDKYAGNCSFDCKSGSRRTKHRAGIGIALLQEFTGFGLGKLMLTRLLELIKDSGCEQAELNVYANNDRALRLYRKLGFIECSRIPDAYKLDNGECVDGIHMYLKFNN